MPNVTLKLKPGHLTLKQIRSTLTTKDDFTLSLPGNIRKILQPALNTINKALDNQHTVYGINTGFGLLASASIEAADLTELQKQLLRSHASGVGKKLSADIVRLISVLKINSLARGYSGIHLDTINLLTEFINQGITPCVPEKGSVGASGDLAPLAHLCLPLIGEGEVRYQGKIMTAKKALKRCHLTAVSLRPKEGLALINGTQVSTALALQGLINAESLLLNSIVIGSMTVEACMASRKPFDEKVHALRGQQGQQHVAALFRKILKHSSIEVAHQNCSKVQDPYSLRCQPQVLGACLDQINHASKILLIEANAVTDNPLVFSEQDEIISAGNFHAEPVALVADNLALAIAEIGALSERRIALMMDKHLSELPPFLVANSGLNSGFMMAQVTAAALASENKSLAHPASVDSLPTSANQEDHVSMATFAARRLQTMAENTRYILAIELLAACQGVELRAPKKPSRFLQKVLGKVREEVAYLEKDRYFSPDIELAARIVGAGGLIAGLGVRFLD